MLVLPDFSSAQHDLIAIEGDTTYMQKAEILYGENKPLYRWMLKKSAPDGYWKIYRDKYKKMLSSEGKIKGGKRDSVWVRYDKKGRKAVEMIYLNGFLNGQEVYFNTRTNSKLMIYTYKNGIKNGPYVIYHANGVKWEEGSFRNGVPNGEWKSWNKEGKLIHTRYYQDGSLVKEQLF